MLAKRRAKAYICAMRWYSGKQLFVFCLASALFAVILVFVFNLVSLNSGDAEQGTDVAAEGKGSMPDLYTEGVNGFTLDGEGPRNAMPGENSGPADSGSALPVQSPSQSFTEDERNNIAIYSLYNEAVVNISTEIVYYSFFEAYPQEGATGSGAIIDKQGYILTNNHVVKNATKLYVTLADGSRLDGTLVGTDPENDLAVVKIDPSGRQLKTIPLGSSKDLLVGQKVLAIGNPFSFDRTLTTGIVSGLGRPIKTESNLVIRNMIQTDASINPGNSGGPLLDSKGNIIGINTMIYSQSGGSIGIGFAVPVDTAKRVVPELIQNGKVRRGWIDIVPIQLFPELVRYARLPVQTGLLVSRVESGSNASQAGIRGGSRSDAVRYGRTIIYLGGDIITEVDNTPIDSLANLYEALEDNKPGDRVKVVYVRGNTRQETIVTLIERPATYSLE